MKKPLKQPKYMMSQTKVRQLVETEHADRVQNIIRNDKNLMLKIREKIIRSEKETFYTVEEENDNRIMNPLEVNESYVKCFETLNQTRERTRRGN